jgi:hypothetical protein
MRSSMDYELTRLISSGIAIATIFCLLHVAMIALIQLRLDRRSRGTI